MLLAAAAVVSALTLAAGPILILVFQQGRFGPQDTARTIWLLRIFLAAVFCSDSIRAMGANMDFELVLPYALARFVPVGLLGFLISVPGVYPDPVGAALLLTLC